MPKARGFFSPDLESRKKIEAVHEFNRKKYENMNKFRAEQSYGQLRDDAGKTPEISIEKEIITDPKEKAIRKIAEMGKNWEENLLKIFMKIDKQEKDLQKEMETWGNLEQEKREEAEYQKALKELRELKEEEIENFKEDEDRSVQEDNSWEGFADENVRGNLEEWDIDSENNFFWYKRIVLDILAEKKSRKGIDFSLELLKSDEEFVQTFQREINRILKSDKQYALEKITGILQDENLDEKATFRLIITATDVFGELLVRDKINSLILEADENKDDKAREKLKFLNSFNTPNLGIESILNLRKFYQTKIKFEDYKVNERMNKKEVALLESLISKDEKVLEMGCGAGRLISELAKSGRDISGYDYTQRHVQITKENLEKNKLVAKVFQGDWHNNALKDGSFDSIYSLGRNILHDYSILSQAELFKETARILKPGGQFIFDIPKREKATEQELMKIWEKRVEKKYALEKLGNSADEKEKELEKFEDELLADFNGYEKMVLKYGLEMKKRGIDNFRFGAIYDSPDGENFATRYTYSQEDILQLAQMFGFEISEIKKEKLETDRADENLYFILKKKRQL